MASTVIPSRSGPLRVVVFVTTPPNTYSGGRYCSLMMANALALAGHEVTYLTNYKPIFYGEFACLPRHFKIDLLLTSDFESNLPEGAFDVVILVPGSKDAAFYLAAQRFALERGARLVLLNFESGNWFNALSPVKRSLSQWKNWKSAARNAAMVLSISREGAQHAKPFYTSCPAKTRFEYFYPPINTVAADTVPPFNREKRVLLMARFQMAEHKGVFQIADLFCEALLGYTVVILVGMGNVPEDLFEEMTARARDFDITIEIKRRPNDVDKFRELKRARLVLFPSYFEGYGMPPIEAQYCNTPCVAFDLPVLRETSGNGIIYAKHGDWDDFKKKIALALAPGRNYDHLHDRIARIAGLEFCADTLDRLFSELRDVPPLAQTIGRAGRARLALRKWTDLKELAKRRLIALGRRVRAWRAENLIPGSVCYYPAFDSQEELTSHYYRARWYLPHVPGRCERVTLFQTLGGRKAGPGPRPEHMCEAPTDGSHIVVRRGRLANLRMLFRSKLVLVWKGYERNILAKFARLFCGVEVVNVATNDLSSIEYGAYCSLIWLCLTSPVERNVILQQNRRRFEAVAERIKDKRFERACVFGTGPSLEKARSFDFTNCLTIVCNTIIQDPALLDHINPTFLSAGDVVSHFGVSTYAAKFRKDLVHVLQTRDIYMLTTASYASVLLYNHPEIKDKVFLIHQTRSDPNYDLLDHYGAPQLDSTLNIHMLPLAATFVGEIWILGCDGKSQVRDNEDFWAHAKGAQYHDLVDTGHVCHPTFDIHRQKSTYGRFLRSTAETVQIGEHEHGIMYRSLRPSNIPALTDRSIPVEFLDQLGPPYKLETLSKHVWGDWRGHFREIPIRAGKWKPPVDPNLPCRLGISRCAVDSEEVLLVEGWFLTPKPIDRAVVILADRRKVATADYRIPRADVFEKYPEYHEPCSGFRFMRKIRGLDERIGPITVQMFSRGELLKSQEVKVAKAEEPFPPQLPCRMGISQCTLDSEGILSLKGWVLSPIPIDKVQLVLEDGTNLGTPERGYLRADVAEKHPEYNDEYCGFLFLDKMDSASSDLGTISLETYARGIRLRRMKVDVKKVD